ncbi:8716_t:CDS:2 [Racocetra fulgida]|uniref:8716_t:CDS:1 n=1 Tax=Racocetra fulgida TaxID=60492 RepID=A0A9N8ZGN7_9GLOM|nr:8716_t:CDS:2 [Racocetra fulgida]
MNTLYLGTMTQYMSTEILGKISLEEVPDIQSIAPDTEIGYALEVDLEAHLYNKRLVYNKEVGGGKYMSEEKLVQTLFTKKNYIVHYRALQTYMKFGMKITKVHSALKFRQSLWIKEYIEENIRKCKIAKANGDEFGVMYYKLKNNAVFGKQMENVCKHMRVELLQIEEDKKIRRLVSLPLFVGFKQFERVLPAGHNSKTSDDPDSEDPKKKHGIQKAKGIKKCVGRKYDNLAKNYGNYLKKLQAEKDPNNYIKTLAVKMFPKEEAYTERLENYSKRYKNNDLYSSLEKLYELYYHIAKEKNREKSDNEIEQMLKAIAI